MEGFWDAICIAKSFLFTLYPDPLPQGERGIKGKNLRHSLIGISIFIFRHLCKLSKAGTEANLTGLETVGKFSSVMASRKSQRPQLFDKEGTIIICPGGLKIGQRHEFAAKALSQR
jgi:hypothetical protein